MANYYAAARTNYFRVKDVEAFKKWLDTVPEAVFIQSVVGKGKKAVTKVGFLMDGADSGSFPSQRYDSESEDDTELDLAQELSKHLLPGEVAVMMESGAEKLRYITGFAVAVNSEGKEVRVNIADIYEKAKKLGENCTLAEY